MKSTGHSRIKGNEHTIKLVSALLFGLICGLIWLLPAYSDPYHKSTRSTLENLRALRLIVPAICAVLGAIIWGKKRSFKILDVLLLFTLVLLPQTSILITGNELPRELVAGLPLLLSCAAILSFSIWDDVSIKYLIVGVGIVSAALIATRLALFGVEITTWYLRPRMHLGFDHPLMTSGAIVGAASAYFLIVSKFKNRLIKRLSMTIGIVATCFFMLQADSRNMLLFIGTTTLAALARYYVPKSWVWRICGSIMVPTLVGIVTISYFLSKGKIGDSGDVSSIQIRLRGFYEVIDKMTIGWSALTGSSIKKLDSFALTDSVYTSYWIHFGFFSLSLLLLLLWMLCTNLTRAKQQSTMQLIGFGSIWATILFFIGDAQGITPANFIVFMGLVLAYRSAVSPTLVSANIPKTDTQ